RSSCWISLLAAPSRGRYSAWATDARGPRSLLFFILLGDDDVRDVCGVQHHGQDARLALLARVPRDAVQAAGRLVKGVPDLQDLGGVVVDGPLVLALQNVAERRAGVAVRRAGLARPQGHLDRRRFRLLPVDLLGDVFPGESLHPAFAVFAVMGQRRPADRA